MKKFNFLLGISIVLLLVFSVFVYAAGSSTLDSDEDDNETKKARDANNSDKPVPNSSDGRKIRRIQGVNATRAKADNVIEIIGECDELDNRTERIKCRLRIHREARADGREVGENYDYDRRTPEACRSLRNPVACIALYKTVQRRGCYELEDGRRKDYCFKRAINVTKGRLGDLPPEERREKARDYLVLLLYELQERVENANENGGIGDNEAAAIIDLIVEVKQNILDGDGRDVVLPKLRELRKMIKDARDGGGDDGGGEEEDEDDENGGNESE